MDENMDENNTRIKIKDYISLYNEHFIRDKKDDYNPTFLIYIIINFVSFPVISILSLLYILNFEQDLTISPVLLISFGSFAMISFILFIFISRKTFINLYHL